MCYHTKFRPFRGAWAYIWGPKFGEVGARPLGMWTCLTPKKYASFELRHQNSVIPGQTVRVIMITDICQKILTPRVRPSRNNVIGTDPDRSAIYDFQFVFHSNYGPISYRFRDNGDICKISPPLYLTPR